MLAHHSRPQSHGPAFHAIFFTVRSIAGLALILASLFAQRTLAKDQNAWPRTGIHNSGGPHKLNAAQLDAVLSALRSKTGLVELCFDASSQLSLGDRDHFAGGSATARELLVSAVDGNSVFSLENHHASAQVAFARLKETTIYHLDSAQIQEYALQLDLSDFSHLSGHKEALAAFDLGIALLHELTHGVRHLQDDQQNQLGLGECEVYVNQMRRELNLPERQHYLAHTTDRANTTTGTVYRVQLVFARSVENGAQSRRQQFFLLYWWTEQVGRV